MWFKENEKGQGLSPSLSDEISLIKNMLLTSQAAVISAKAKVKEAREIIASTHCFCWDINGAPLCGHCKKREDWLRENQ